MYAIYVPYLRALSIFMIDVYTFERILRRYVDVTLINISVNISNCRNDMWNGYLSAWGYLETQCVSTYNTITTIPRNT